MVKLIQASLAIWGLFGSDREDLELDGLFCNETKEGLAQWRQLMGMHEKIEVRFSQRYFRFIIRS